MPDAGGPADRYQAVLARIRTGLPAPDQTRLAVIQQPTDLVTNVLR